MTAKKQYCVGASLGKEKHFTNWSKKSTDPEWHSALYFVVPFEKASSRRDGLCFYLYKKGLFGVKHVVAKHEFDPGRINFYEASGPTYLDFMTTGKKPELYGRIQIKVQYVRGSDYFTCPNCPRLTNHTPAFLLGNIASVTLEKNSLFKKGVQVRMKCGKTKEMTDLKKDGKYDYHFLLSPKEFLKQKTIIFNVYKKQSYVGTCFVKVDDLLEGNVCELTLSVKHGKKEAGKLVVLLQTIYECSDCVVEREDEDGSVDIPMRAPAPAPAPVPAPLPEVQIVGNIPGMSLPMKNVSQPAAPQPVPPMPQGVFPAAPAPIVIEQPPVVTVSQPQLYATPVPMQGMACNVYSTSYQY